MTTFAQVGGLRIATRFSIKLMDLAESAAYLRHHLRLAGREEPLFADDAIARLYRVSNALPRALNNAATAALIAPAAGGKDLVDDACAKKQSPNSPGTDHAPARPPGATRQPPADRRRAAGGGPHQPRGRRPHTPACRPGRAPPRDRCASTRTGCWNGPCTYRGPSTSPTRSR